MPQTDAAMTTSPGSVRTARAVVLERPESLSVRELALDPVGEHDLVIDIDYSGISTGTEKLLWNGRMPVFPGMGYPLVPGYESVGRVVDAGGGAQPGRCRGRSRSCGGGPGTHRRWGRPDDR